MNIFDSELQTLSELYSSLSAELSGLARDNRPESPSATTRCILRNQALFARLERMNSRLDELAAEWEKLSPKLDVAARKKTRQLAARVREQAVNLWALSEARSQEIEALRSRLESALAGIKDGTKYLESVKPLRNNFPKFIDSHG